jgi:hypothetical protein
MVLTLLHPSPRVELLGSWTQPYWYQVESGPGRQYVSRGGDGWYGGKFLPQGNRTFLHKNLKKASGLIIKRGIEREGGN